MLREKNEYAKYTTVTARIPMRTLSPLFRGFEKSFLKSNVSVFPLPKKPWCPDSYEKHESRHFSSAGVLWTSRKNHRLACETNVQSETETLLLFSVVRAMPWIIKRRVVIIVAVRRLSE